MHCLLSTRAPPLLFFAAYLRSVSPYLQRSQETRSQGSRGQQQLVLGSPLILSPRTFCVSNFSVSQEAVPPMLTLVAVIVPLLSEALSLFHCP